ncbi:MAG: ABC transporter permease [Patescibacteria group bacterium]|nr:ABC transporter permease [Patescibacteria group bacterium]MDE2172584.1 ABC transporter permease [Patescibacteria group bacterium]
MTWKHVLKTSLTGLSTNRSRSALTILGIVIGITAIMLVISLGAGAQALILGEVQGLGTNTIAIIPGQVSTSPTSNAGALYSDSLKPQDVTALLNKANVPQLQSLMPVVIAGDTATYGSNTYQVTVFGGTDLIADIFNLVPAEGQFFDSSDVLSLSSVVVIGADVQKYLFDTDEPLNENIKIKGRNFRVIGVLPKSGGGSLFNFDSMVIMPYTTVMTYVTGQKYYNRIITQAVSDAAVPMTAADIRQTLEESHNITDPTKDDFTIETQQTLANTLGTITNALTYFLVAVASIALFVGGVGIMNIMLVAVTERTREIGLRKALGARDRDILSQFLLEAVLLTAIGGIIGIVLGSSLAFLISLILSKGLGVNWQFVFPWSGAVLGFSVSAVIGLIFGGYPARQASKKSPIEALRYE